jgi:hypothetical protein
MSIYEILSVLDLTQSVHAKISIEIHRGVKFKISRIPLIAILLNSWTTPRDQNRHEFCYSMFLNERSMSIIYCVYASISKISIGMHRVVKFKISRIPLIGLETRLRWRTDRKFLRNLNLNEIKLAYNHRNPKFYLLNIRPCDFAIHVIKIVTNFATACF